MFSIDCDTSSETEAGDSSDDELPSVKLMLVDEKHGTKGKAPTSVKLQGSPSKMAASAVDPAPETKEEPKGMYTLQSCSVLTFTDTHNIIIVSCIHFSSLACDNACHTPCVSSQLYSSLIISMRILNSS